MKAASLAPLPPGWTWKQLGDCARLINGRAYAQEELLDSGTPVLRIQNLNGGDRWYYSDLQLPEEKYCEAGDLLYAWSASFGPYRFDGPKSIFHYHIWRVVPFDDLDKDFAFHLLEWITDEVKGAAHGVAMLHMTKAGMESWMVPIPPLPEQRRIADILDRAESLGAKRRAAIAQLDELTQAIFVEMFGDPVANPMGWPRKTLGDLILSASDGPHVSPSYVDEGVPFLSTRHVRVGEIVWNDLKYISEEDAQVHWRKCKPQRGDILYTKGGTTGLAACVKTDRDFAVWVHVALLKPKFAIVDSLWLESMLNTQFCYDQSQHYTHGIANRDLGLTRMVKIGLIQPPLSEQRRFANQRAQVEQLRTHLESSLQELDSLAESLQHRAFRGEL